jgi:hypothetical protein
MPMTVRAKAPDLRGLARDLKAAGRRDLQKELFSALNRATKPVREEIKANAFATLPASGGLNERVAASNVTVRGSGGRVRIVARPSKRGGTFDPAKLDGGAVDHPTYGHRPTVRNQRVQPGWFSEPAAAAGADVYDALNDAIEKVAADLAAG